MGKDPAFLFYPNDYLGGTMGMTLEQKGGYMELLMMQFNLGKFTEAQAKQVLSICFDVAWPTIKQKFETDGVLFWNVRLAEEIDRRKRFSESRRLNASGTKSNKASAKHMHNHMHNHMETEAETETKDVKETIPKIIKVKYKDNILLSDKEYNKLLERDGKLAVDWMLDKLSNYKLANGKKYASDYGAINSWVRSEYEKQHQLNTNKAIPGA